MDVEEGRGHKVGRWKYKNTRRQGTQARDTGKGHKQGTQARDSGKGTQVRDSGKGHR